MVAVIDRSLERLTSRNHTAKVKTEKGGSFELSPTKP
jgi:hypothetical protein